MAGEYNSITEGFILLATIIGWNILLVRHGRVVHSNLRREYLTPEEVMSKLREQGVAHLRQVRHAYMESDGQISVIRNDGP